MFQGEVLAAPVCPARAEDGLRIAELYHQRCRQVKQLRHPESFQKD